MKFKKSLLVISVFFLIFLSFSAVQAADNDTSTPSQVTINEKTFDAIQSGVGNSSSHDTLILDGLYTGFKRKW